MTNALDLIAGGSLIQFPAAPLRSGSAVTVQRFQTRAFDSAGNPYVYSKSTASRQTHPLTFNRVTTAVLASLLAFVATVKGRKTACLWYDHAAAAHTVHFDSAIAYTETAAGFFRVSFTLAEDL